MTSAEIGELAKALAAAQGEFPPIPKDCTAKVKTKSGSEYSFRYADLETILAVVRPVLSRHGLALMVDVEACEVNLPASRDKPSTTLGMAARVRLMHSSGQWIESRPLAVPCDPEALGRQYAQAVGSAATYATRYAIEAALSVRATEDTDGSEASGNATTVERQAPRPASPAAAPPPAKPVLLPALADFLNEFGWPKERKAEFAGKLLSHYEVTLAELVQDSVRASAVLHGLQAEVKAIMQADSLITDRADAMQILFSRAMEGTR